MSMPQYLKIGIGTQAERVRINSTLSITRIVRGVVGLYLAPIFAEKLGFSYDVKAAKDRQVGIRLPNGSWTGLMGMIQRGEADMLIGLISPSDDRMELVDFGYPFGISTVTFATRKPEYIPDPWAFVKPFSLPIWTAIVTSLLIMTVVFFVLFQKKYTVKKHMFYLYSKIVGQDIGVETNKTADYILVLSWDVGIMFLIFSYAAVLLSFLTFPPLYMIRTIPELAAAVRQGKYNCFTQPGTYFPGALAHSYDSNSKVIGENLMQNKYTYDIDGTLAKKKSKTKSAFVTASGILALHRWKYFISEDSFLTIMPAVAFKKGFCCRAEFDKVVSHIWPSGIYKKSMGDYTFKIALQNRYFDAVSDGGSERSLTMEDLMGVFIILFAGLLLSTIVFSVEVIIGKSKKSRRFRKFKRTFI